jgi:hypothetical protein
MVGVKTRMDGYKQSERKSQSRNRRTFSHAPSSAEFVEARDSARECCLHTTMVTKIGLSSELGSRGTVQADLTGS